MKRLISKDIFLKYRLFTRFVLWLPTLKCPTFARTTDNEHQTAAKPLNMRKVYIVSAVRTPIGSFGGVFPPVCPLSNPLGAAHQGRFWKRPVSARSGTGGFHGNVYSLTHRCGNKAWQAAGLYAGIPIPYPCTTVNKVCSSGAKAIMFAVVLSCSTFTVTLSSPAAWKT